MLAHPHRVLLIHIKRVAARPGACVQKRVHFSKSANHLQKALPVNIDLNQCTSPPPGEGIGRS
jgi:hypothetical protein